MTGSLSWQPLCMPLAMTTEYTFAAQLSIKMILSQEKHHRPLIKCLWPFVDDMPGMSGGPSLIETNGVVSLLIFIYISIHRSTF